jgi:hypothetical protein
MWKKHIISSLFERTHSYASTILFAPYDLLHAPSHRREITYCIEHDSTFTTIATYPRHSNSSSTVRTKSSHQPDKGDWSPAADLQARLVWITIVIKMIGLQCSIYTFRIESIIYDYFRYRSSSIKIRLATTRLLRVRRV